jgi:hypothetical protein
LVSALISMRPLRRSLTPLRRSPNPHPAEPHPPPAEPHPHPAEPHPPPTPSAGHPISPPDHPSGAIPEVYGPIYLYICIHSFAFGMPFRLGMVHLWYCNSNGGRAYDNMVVCHVYLVFLGFFRFFRFFISLCTSNGLHGGRYASPTELHLGGPRTYQHVHLHPFICNWHALLIGDGATMVL